MISPREDEQEADVGTACSHHPVTPGRRQGQVCPIVFGIAGTYKALWAELVLSHCSLDNFLSFLLTGLM